MTSVAQEAEDTSGEAAGVKCSGREEGECGTPGPFMAHCTEDDGHLWGCNHADTGLSWDETQWVQYVLGAHNCGDEACPAHGRQGPWL